MLASRLICFSALYLLLAVTGGQLACASDRTLIQGNLVQGDLAVPVQSKGNDLVSPPGNKDLPAPRLSPADAAKIVHKQLGGQVMSVSTKRTATGTVYGVKILTSGRMRVVRVDGDTGRILN